MAVKTSWHRDGTKLRHCHAMYRPIQDLEKGVRQRAWGKNLGTEVPIGPRATWLVVVQADSFFDPSEHNIGRCTEYSRKPVVWYDDVIKYDDLRPSELAVCVFASFVHCLIWHQSHASRQLIFVITSHHIIGVNAAGVAGVATPSPIFWQVFYFFPSAKLLNTASRCHFYMHHITPFWNEKFINFLGRGTARWEPDWGPGNNAHGAPCRLPHPWIKNPLSSLVSGH